MGPAQPLPSARNSIARRQPRYDLLRTRAVTLARKQDFVAASRCFEAYLHHQPDAERAWISYAQVRPDTLTVIVHAWDLVCATVGVYNWQPVMCTFSTTVKRVPTGVSTAYHEIDRRNVFMKAIRARIAASRLLFSVQCAPLHKQDTFSMTSIVRYS